MPKSGKLIDLKKTMDDVFLSNGWRRKQWLMLSEGQSDEVG